MGIDYVDISTIGHFLGGFTSSLLLKRTGMNKYINFILTNTIHGIIEFIEKPTRPDGTVLESTKNHIGDIIAFLIGWFCGISFNSEKYINKYWLVFLWVILSYCIFNEVTRELFPNEYFFLQKGAYLKTRW